MAKVKRFIPKEIACPTWNIKELTSEERSKLKNNLIIGLIDNEEDYKAVISYMYSKYPFEMDGLKTPETGKENVAIQWKYSTAKNKFKVFNRKTNKCQDMYAFVVYDSAKDMEPVIFAGSYFKLGQIPYEIKDDLSNFEFKRNAMGILDAHGKYQVFGQGYVMFCDPNYRRLGLATDLWLAEAQLYREALGIRFQREIQNEYSLISTQKMFSNPSKCIITSPGRIKNDGTRSQIRVLLDYKDTELEDSFNNMLPGLKQIYNKPDWTFLEREGLTKKELIKLWD